MHTVLVFAVLFSCGITGSDGIPSLQQTVPPGGVAVCPHSTVEFTCVSQQELSWLDLNTSTAQPAFYGTSQTLITGVFRTVLTEISDNTLTSTATIDSVSLNDDGVRISCHDNTGQRIASVHVEGPPNASNNLMPTPSDTESSVNLTWFLDNQCVVVYHVEVTNTNTSNIKNMNTTSQYIVLTLQTGVVYSFRVRGVDSAGRGEWSGLFKYPWPPNFPPTTERPTNSGFPTGVIISLPIGFIVFMILVFICCIAQSCRKY